MASNPEEFFVEGLMEPPPPSPSVFLDLPPTPDGDSQGPLSSDDLMLSNLSRVLMEEDTDDTLLCHDPALLLVQQPFAQILSSPSFGANKEGTKDLLQDDSGDLASSKGVDAVEAFFKGMEEASKLLPRDRDSRKDEQVNQMASEEMGNCRGLNKRYNRDEHLEEVVCRSSKAMTMMEEPEAIGADEMYEETLLHVYEICISFMQNLRITMDDETEKNKNICSKAATDVVDLRTLLIHCAQAVAANNHMSARELLKQINQHASATGDATQRLAYYFAKGLEARLVGTGSQLWRLVMAERPSVVEFLQAYNLFMAACCFIKVGVIFTIMIILHAMVGKTKLHIVDYGLHHGFHWAALLRELASREGVPPEVKITAIGRPQNRSCPTERIEMTGCRLRKCAREFGLPFQFRAINTKNWEQVCIEDLNTEADEVLIVNDVFNFSTLMDENVFFDLPSPRDIVLNNIRKMRPDVFIQSIVNSSYGTSFSSRFREALFYYTALFDMLDATIPRESKPRLVLEKGLFGCSALNLLACEGVDLVDRPEKYRQWQARNKRAGLRQLALESKLVKGIKDKVKKQHHKDFLISEDGQWLLQGWMGRILFAHSTWVAEDASSE